MASFNAKAIELLKTLEFEVRMSETKGEGWFVRFYAEAIIDEAEKAFDTLEVKYEKCTYRYLNTFGPYKSETTLRKVDHKVIIVRYTELKELNMIADGFAIRIVDSIGEHNKPIN